MSAQIIVITGASDGIGAAAARELAAAGEQVVLVGRSADKTAALAAELGASHHVADFAELAQVRELAATLNRAYPRIDVLANNAGAIMGQRELTADGFEKTFQVNHLAPFLLTQLLLDRLITSHAKVIQTSSAAARLWGLIDTNDLQHTQAYSPTRAYGDAKLANIMFTRELHRRYHDQGLSAAAFHPGVVATNFASESTSWFRLLYATPLRRLGMRSARRGARGLIWLAQGTPGRDWISGTYYEDNRPARSALQADDEVIAEQLWEASAAMLRSRD
jgi:NAD(P)-dependent dehydrogenase (short-subunit alcohol dehydrogenase family)